jgi:cyclopropane-fatty-acyl-phospholipid synthase
MNQDEQRAASGTPDIGKDGFSPELPAILAKGEQRSGFWLGVLMYILKDIRVGQLDITLPGGEQRSFRGTERPDLHGVLHIRSSRVVSHVLRNGEVGFGEAYLDRCWDSPDLARLLQVLYLNEPHFSGPYEKNVFSRLYGWWQHRRRHNSKDNARRNIEAHYDLGNEFYKMWLDDTMAYSAGVFSEPNQTLREAQLNKFALMYGRLDLRPEHHLLEIGSGWGGFAIYAAQQSGCRVTSITLSREQLEEARLRAQQAGVADRVKFELRDYRDVRETYDRIVSIEMYEAVGAEYWPDYFAAIRKALRPGGRAALQGITISPRIFDQYRSKQDFIQKYIFPGGMLATPEMFQSLAAKAGLRSEQPLFYARDYADTLAHWHRNVLARREHIVQHFDERFLRMWRYYLAYCEAGFRTGSIDLMQLTLV